MTPKLSEDQRQALVEHGGKPIYVVDATTNTDYVLLRADQFDKVKALIGNEAEFDPRETYPAVDQVFREDWDDPAMDAYDNYDAHRNPA